MSVKLLIRLQLKFSHLSKQKFCHNFKDCVSPMCNCDTEIGTMKHFSLRCQFLFREKQNLYDDFCLIDSRILSFDEESLLNALLYGSDSVFRNKFYGLVFLEIFH